MTLFDNRAVQSVGKVLKHLPGTSTLLQTDTWRSLRHSVTLLTARRQNFITTKFLRLPNQFDALTGPVVDFLAPAGTDRPLEIVVVGCSVGAEPYSAASELFRKRPGLQFTLRAFDIDPAVLVRAREARYSSNNVFQHAGIDSEFVAATFDREGETYVVKDAIRRAVTFAVADVLDPRLKAVTGVADIVLAQNLLYNLRPRDAVRAFDNVCEILRPRGALFVDGMDLTQRTRLTRGHGLEPLDFRIEAIHEDARRERARSWPWFYWGIEPYAAARQDRVRRYATVFLKG